MLSGGVEVMVGITHDPLFGPLIAFGLGGIHVEILGDVQFRVAPLTDHDAAEMIRGIKGYRLLTGYRGRPTADLKAIQNVLLCLSRLVEATPEISEIDLNPIFALPEGHGCKIADARIRIELPQRTGQGMFFPCKPGVHSPSNQTIATSAARHGCRPFAGR